MNCSARQILRKIAGGRRRRDCVPGERRGGRSSATGAGVRTPACRLPPSPGFACSTRATTTPTARRHSRRATWSCWSIPRPASRGLAKAARRTPCATARGASSAGTLSTPNSSGRPRSWTGSRRPGRSACMRSALSTWRCGTSRARRSNVPLDQLFGGQAREHIELYATSGLPQGLVPPAEARTMGLKDRAAATMAAGYRVYPCRRRHPADRS